MKETIETIPRIELALIIIGVFVLILGKMTRQFTPQSRKRVTAPNCRILPMELKAASTEEVETCVLKSPSMTLPIPSMAASR